MIFGIKTKKDRKIEKLKEEIALLHGQLKTTLSEPPIIHRSVELKPIIARYVVCRLQSTPCIIYAALLVLSVSRLLRA